MSRSERSARSDLEGRPEPRRGRLFLKYVALFVAVVSIALLTNGLFEVWFSYQEHKAALVRIQHEQADSAAAKISQFFKEIEGHLGWTTQLPWAASTLEQRRFDALRLLRQVPAVTELAQLDASGKEQLRVSRLAMDVIGSGTDYSNDPKRIEAMARKAYYGPVYFRRESEPYMTLAVAGTRRDAGISVAEVNLKLIWDVVSQIKVGEKGHAYVLDAQGRLIAHPDISLVLRNTNMSRLPQVQAARDGHAREQDQIREAQDAQGRWVLTAYAKVPRLDWFVFVELPVQEAYAPLYASIQRSAAVLLGALFLAALAGLFLARRMIVPIRALREGAERLGSGDLGQRIAVKTGDELEALASQFNDMAGKLQDSYADLEKKVEERTQELSVSLQQQTATAEVLKVISRSTFDLQTVLDTLVASAARLCQAENAFVFQREGDLCRLIANHGFSAEYVQWMREHPIEVGRGSLVGRTVVESQTVHIPDCLADPEYVWAESQKRGGFRTMLGLPLLREGTPIGVLALCRHEVEPFADSQIELVRTFADQAVIAIENVRLFEEVQARTRDLTESLEYQTATGEVLKVISSSPDSLQPVLDVIVEVSHRLCGSENSTIFLLADGKYHLTAASGGTPTYVETARANPIPADAPGSASARAARLGRTVHIPDTASDPEAGQGMLAMGDRRAVLSVPLMREGVAVGVITMRQTFPHAFSARQIEVVETFADQAVIAISNVRLFEEVQARTRELQQSLEYQTATSDVLNVISRSTTELQPVLDALADSAARLSESISATILLRDGDVVIPRAHVGPLISPLGERQPLDRGWVTGRAVLEGRTVHVPDMLETSEADYPYGRKMALAYGHRATLASPLMREGSAIGAILVRREEARPFSDKQIALLETFADQAVIAIENTRLFEEVQARTRELTASLEDLRKAQDRLIQSEKLASLGQLTAGIAHEIKNPLNFVNNFADVSTELVDELNAALAPVPLDQATRDEVDELTGMLKANLDKVVQHGRRADSIVKNMLLHSREGTGEIRSVDLNATAEESLNLAYHGARAEKPNFNVTLEKHLDPDVGSVDLYPQEFVRVLLNLISNGFYAAHKRKSQGAEPGFEPTLTLSTKGSPDRVEIRVRDNGTGIPEDIKAKMFNPFFTTKPAGEGTGLGLSLSYDIVAKQHGGTIEVDTKPGEFTEFVITLPRRAGAAADLRRAS